MRCRALLPALCLCLSSLAAFAPFNPTKDRILSGPAVDPIAGARASAWALQGRHEDIRLISTGCWLGVQGWREVLLKPLGTP